MCSRILQAITFFAIASIGLGFIVTKIFGDGTKSGAVVLALVLIFNMIVAFNMVLGKELSRKLFNLMIWVSRQCDRLWVHLWDRLEKVQQVKDDDSPES